MFKQNKINRIEPLQIPLTSIRQEGQKHPRPLGKLVKPLCFRGGFLFIEAKKGLILSYIHPLKYDVIVTKSNYTKYNYKRKLRQPIKLKCTELYYQTNLIPVI